MLKSHLPILYIITDKLFSTYRRTYTKDLEKGEVKLVKKRVTEAFENAKIRIPTDEEIKKKFAELSKKGKIIG
jgi:helix-turn-helix protein